MDDSMGSALQQLADAKLDGHLRERVEALRAEGQGWRETADAVSKATGLHIGKSTLHRWAEDNGWTVDAAEPATRAAS